MSSTMIGLAVLPVVVFLVVVMECSRLHCARIVQRRLATPLHDAATDENSR